jgi:hypothetical protein
MLADFYVTEKKSGVFRNKLFAAVGEVVDKYP